jgi:dnd system-associated protein 4
MRDIRRPEALEPIVDRFTNPAYSDVGRPVFPTIMELLIFSAGVGFAIGKRIPVPASGKSVPFRVFENNQREGYIYLIALAHTRDPKSLASECDDDAAKIFEEFAAGGLEELGAWLNASPMDTSGVQTLVTQIQKYLPRDKDPEPDELDPV